MSVPRGRRGVSVPHAGLSKGSVVELTIEKPAFGGRMIARHDGQVVLVSGAIPGERVTAIVERVEKRLAFATVQAVIEASPHRRTSAFDPACGGSLYAHIDYHTQVALKSEVVVDAFTRIGRMPPPGPVPVAHSPERGYRMRARLHAHGGRAGFYLEGTHQLCEAAPTGQLTDAALGSVQAALAALGSLASEVVSIEIAENVAADERALHIELRAADPLPVPALVAAVAAAQLTGCSSRSATGTFARAGEPVVSDPLHALTGGRAANGSLRRHAASFFQGNRFLLAALVGHVLDAIPGGGDVLDLYAGVGLFSVSLAAAGRQGIVAVEGDRESGADLLRNAAAYAGSMMAVVGLVEDYVRRPGARPATVIVDPPRSGISQEAMDAIRRLSADRIVYVSCDPPTMARDARRLVDAAYVLASLTGYDLFPSTPHVEVVGVFEREK
ncbi:MAG: rRNA (uracil1939-C5)-methyltransferase [Acidobacteriota bacterium]|jgi:23S rRNA (uracil1939-C5)-methyltransferase